MIFMLYSTAVTKQLTVRSLRYIIYLVSEH